MKRKTTIAVALLCAAALYADALPSRTARPPRPMKIVQVDLARQMETMSFLSNYVDTVAALGFDTLHLYVEGRIATKSFALPKGEGYPAEDVRQLVEYAASKGIMCVPCVGLLGHAGLFFQHPGLENLNETRGATPRLGGGNDTFCISKPETREFLKRYVAEVASLFPGPYFNVGLDEAWNAGVCPLCAPKERRDELFTETVLLAHEAVTAAGKRMWMWDDFFEFHPSALAATPRDVVLCHWNYNTDISPLGSRGHFAGRERKDWLGLYASMGFDVIPSCWFRSGNAESLLAYSRRHPAIGFMATQWEEMFTRFPSGSLPRIAAVSLMLSSPSDFVARDPYPEAVRMVLPFLSPAENAAVVSILHSERTASRAGLAALEAALATLRGSAMVGGDVEQDPFSGRAILDDIVCRAEADLISGRLAALKPICADPRRTADDVRAVKAELPRLSAAADRLAERRLRQAALWRAGLNCIGKIDQPSAAAKKTIGELMAVPESPAPADERRLVVNLVLPEYYGIPRWKIHGRFTGGWRELAAGVWKPRETEPAEFERHFTFKAAEMPAELRVEHSGYGRAQLAYVSVDDRSSRVVPAEVLSVEGDVEHAERLLSDDLEWADFGTCGFREKFFDAEKAAKVSSVTLRMKQMLPR
ncbi:MAG: family 20 glycosylhydrolase [Kiritimatiellae bacterium]|nr:family 20 glycosylhydrolase [Kiritimatiellia bacterium]